MVYQRNKTEEYDKTTIYKQKQGWQRLCSIDLQRTVLFNVVTYKFSSEINYFSDNNWNQAQNSDFRIPVKFYELKHTKHEYTMVLN